MKKHLSIWRRWLRFSLRSLLFVMLLAAVYLSGWRNGRNSVEPPGPVFADFDADGDLDLYMANGAHSATLFVNQADGTFTARDE